MTGSHYTTWYLMKNVTMKITAEQNRDGRVQITAGTCGEEGKSRKKKILELQKPSDEKCMVYVAFVGRNADDPCWDEFCNSQLGNKQSILSGQ